MQTSPFFRRAVVACFLACLAPLSLAAREIVIQHFDEQIVISPDGTIEVAETIEARFIGSNWHGIYRTIPVDYITPAGLNYSLLLELRSVTDDAGQALTYERSSRGRDVQFKIYVPNPDNATRTVVLRYRVLNALTFFEAYDELYWNVTGNGWEAPIKRVTAEIDLPAGVTGLHAVSYSGAFGSRAQDAEVESKSNSVEFHSTHPLGFHGGLTVVVGWDKGFVHEPAVSQRILFILRSNWPIFIPLAVFILMFYWWWTSGRDPKRDAITVQYEPPDNLSPAECGTLVDGKVAMCDITATLVDLAVKGYLTIEHVGGDASLGLANDYVFHLRKPSDEWNNLKPHERQMLRGIFVPESPLLMLLDKLQDVSGNLPPAFTRLTRAMAMPGAQQYPAITKEYSEASHTVPDLEKVPLPKVALSELQNRFSFHLPIISEYIFDTLKRDGYYVRRPDKFRQGIVVLGVLTGLLTLLIGSLLMAATETAPLPWIVAAILNGIIISVFGRFMTGRTVAGARAFAKVLGFEDFLGRVEKDQIERLDKTPELFEKYLPFAMALRVDKKWVQTFSRIAVQPPQWYQGADGSTFQPSLLVNDLNLMSSHAGSVMTSSSRSSGGLSSSSGATSGSGFSETGSSGGGFGGGGGGGF
ncbi:MAG: DUF2207 domain-containing protein [Candidatus Sulfotelmatobacter sp.]|jgi:uncharacterized membrane protein